MSLTRRSFVAAAAGSLTVFSRSLRAASANEFSFTQYHNQTPASSLHKRLTEMWEAIARESGGRVTAKVYPQNNNIQGSDPAALKALVGGDIQFFTLMGGILGTIMPVAEAQQVPFAFTSAQHAHRAMDGPLGAYLVEEMAAKGIHGFRVGAFDNGMREITAHKRIASPADLAGLKMRVPAGQLVADTFKAFGCEPVTINSDEYVFANAYEEDQRILQKIKDERAKRRRPELIPWRATDWLEERCMFLRRPRRECRPRPNSNRARLPGVGSN